MTKEQRIEYIKMKWRDLQVEREAMRRSVKARRDEEYGKLIEERGEG